MVKARCLAWTLVQNSLCQCNLHSEANQVQYYKDTDTHGTLIECYNKYCIVFTCSPMVFGSLKEIIPWYGIRWQHYNLIHYYENNMLFWACTMTISVVFFKVPCKSYST